MKPVRRVAGVALLMLAGIGFSSARTDEPSGAGTEKTVFDLSVATQKATVHSEISGNEDSS
jgi:hypothetical protein